MEITTILALVFGWLFFNTWAAIAFTQSCGEFFSGWDDYLWLFIMSITTPIPFMLGRWFFILKRKWKLHKKKA